MISYRRTAGHGDSKVPPLPLQTYTGNYHNGQYARVDLVQLYSDSSATHM